MFLLFLIHGIKRGASFLPRMFPETSSFSAVNAGGQCSSSLESNVSGADGLKQSSAQVRVKPPVPGKRVSNLSFITTRDNPPVAGLFKINSLPQPLHEQQIPVLPKKRWRGRKEGEKEEKRWEERRRRGRREGEWGEEKGEFEKGLNIKMK